MCFATIIATKRDMLKISQNQREKLFDRKIGHPAQDYAKQTSSTITEANHFYAKKTMSSCTSCIIR